MWQEETKVVVRLQRYGYSLFRDLIDGDVAQWLPRKGSSLDRREHLWVVVASGRRVRSRSWKDEMLKFE